MNLTKNQATTIEREYSRPTEFSGYTKHEIFQLGMREALKLCGIEFSEDGKCLKANDATELKVALKKKDAHTLLRNSEGVWTLDGKVIDQEQAIAEMAEAVNDLGYWCQVAKDVLDEEDFELVQTSYEHDPEQV